MTVFAILKRTAEKTCSKRMQSARVGCKEPGGRRLASLCTLGAFGCGKCVAGVGRSYQIDTLIGHLHKCVCVCISKTKSGYFKIFSNFGEEIGVMSANEKLLTHTTDVYVCGLGVCKDERICIHWYKQAISSGSQRLSCYLLF